jgi:hypothetical protein
MSKLMGLVREQQRRRAGINDDVMLLHWADFDEGRPAHALGIQQKVDEPYKDFVSRVEATARVEGLRAVFIDNIRGGGLG